jgi:hypothetical protein
MRSAHFSGKDLSTSMQLPLITLFTGIEFILISAAKFCFGMTGNHLLGRIDDKLFH